MEIYNNSLMKSSTGGNIPENPFENIQLGHYKDGKREVVSTVAYLIGVPKHIFEREYEPPRMERYTELEQDKTARIIRNLCMIRTAIERNFKNINDAMRLDFRTIFNMPEYIPSDALDQLRSDGVSFVKKTSTRLSHHIIEINRLISDRINNCKDLFPLWVKWDYIRELFLMPNGLSELGTKAAADLYYANKELYPYKVYINWTPVESGNILYDDRKFMTILYEQHNDYFVEFSKTTDAGDRIKNSIYDFLERSRRTIVFVDCENSDPYKLCAALRSLREEELSTISKIILFDDIHTTMAWKMLENFTEIPVEHMMIERLHAGKSLVDGRLIARACQEYYQNSLDSMILVSSDSDYWALISSLPFANFLVMVERDACGSDLKNALSNSNIYYCYLDDFYTGGEEELKFAALRTEIQRRLEPFTFNINDMLAESIRTTRASMSGAEQARFLEKYLRRLALEVSADGSARICLRTK